MKPMSPQIPGLGSETHTMQVPVFTRRRRACPTARSDINRPAPASFQRSRTRSLITLLEHLSNPSERYGHHGFIRVAAHKPSSFAHQGRRNGNRARSHTQVGNQIARLTEGVQQLDGFSDRLLPLVPILLQSAII